MNKFVLLLHKCTLYEGGLQPCDVDIVLFFAVIDRAKIPETFLL